MTKIYFVLLTVLLVLIGICAAKPQIVSVSWPGGAYFGNFYPFVRPVFRRPLVVVNPAPVVPVYAPYYYY